MKFEENKANGIVAKSDSNGNGVSTASSHKQESMVVKNESSQEQTYSSQMKTSSISNFKEMNINQQNGSNGNPTNGNILKVHHATMESVGHEFHQVSSVQQTGYDGVSLFGTRKTSANGLSNNVSNGTHSIGNENFISCPMELPEVKPLQTKHSDAQNGNIIVPPERKEESIASEYFQSKYGSEQSENTAKKPVHYRPLASSKQSLVNEINSTIAGKKSNAATSVRVQQEKPVAIKSRSKTATPERESRASSISKNKKGGDFSYLSLLPDDGSFPHRTHPIGDPQTSRRSSIQYGQTGRMSKAGSTEQLNQTEKKNFMVRSNPIGLAEPSIKRDGYAVSKDGSFYRSTEHLFENKVSQSTSRAGSEAPEGNWRGK